MRRTAVVIVASLVVPSWTRADGDRPAVVVRLSRPADQLERFLNLFQGARAPHPAAALSGWRRATMRPEGLSKGAQAAIALLNPEMVHELRSLDQAELGFWIEAGRLHWFAVIPGDDGTFAALATALTLTGGGREVPIGEVALDRLGPPGTAVMGRNHDGAAVLAGDRDDIPVALERLEQGSVRVGPPRSGWLVRLEPAALATSNDLRVRRASALLDGLGCRSLEAELGLLHDTLTLEVAGRLNTAAASDPIDPGWLDWIPAEGAAASCVLALDPTSLETAFRTADRVEKADPERARAGPIRARLDLAALAAGIRPESDLWPHLRGLTAWITLDGDGAVARAALALHARDVASADRVADRIIAPMLASRLGRAWKNQAETAIRGSTVLLAWGGGVVAACDAARSDPERSAGATLRQGWADSPPGRIVAVWPGRLTDSVPPDLAGALALAPPIIWCGASQGRESRDVIRWSGLRDVVRHYLNHLPMTFDDPIGR
jgi:hypothetical protein